ncbi:MAG: PHP domain-containing protein [Atopobiaceae bacterium]|nr:PHP domain-containing protein [Atopobiaceae bacterium]
MLNANYHTHTTFCDGTSTAEEQVFQALELGFFALGFSSHVDPDIPMDWNAYSAEILRLRAAHKGELDILLGAELDNLWDRSHCPEAEFVIGSTHYIPVGTPHDGCVDWSAEVSEQCCREFFGGDWYAYCRAYYEFEAQVYDRTQCTFVGHFDLVTRFNDDLHAFDEEDPRYVRPALEAMEYLVRQGIPFEINCGAFNRGRKAELYPRRSLLRALHDFGGEIFITSDAHQRELLAGGFDTAVDRAIECGFTHVNALYHDASGAVAVRQLALDTL